MFLVMSLGVNFTLISLKKIWVGGECDSFMEKQFCDNWTCERRSIPKNVYFSHGRQFYFFYLTFYN